MRELRGSYRVYFGLALTLCGAALLCMASTWLPGEYTVPKWLETGLFVSFFPVFAVAFICAFTSGAATQLLGRGNTDRLIRYALLLPPALKLTYALIICLAALGIATGAGTAEDAQADASGYFYTYWDKTSDPQHSARVELTKPEYYEALRSQLRVFCAVPALLHAFASFLILSSASAAATRPRTAPECSHGSTEQPRWP
ncbi:hypothetical protein [Streptomyces sp. NBC_00236]|uniref:hypothetical protein n=1 Tax=Streptomyces sp. NBC_00236 TaxID=2903639 RepID=UPI002E2C113D|nr:hypothetical protein [Streptomyces sp. NBC_00236]